MKLAPENKTQSNKKSDWKLDLFDSVLYLQKAFIVYNPAPDTNLELSADNLNVDNREKIERYD